MFLIWGFRTRNKPAGSPGQFYCTTCSLPMTYVPLRQTTYFHIFFVPLLPISSEPHGIQCTGCKHLFEEEAIYYAPKKQMSSWKCPVCSKRWSESSICCPLCKVRPDGSPIRASTQTEESISDVDANSNLPESNTSKNNPMDRSGGPTAS